MSFPLHRPSCFETGEPIDIEHHIMYNVIAAGQPELISLEKSLKEAMVSAGTARESEYGREFPLFEVEATVVEPIFERLYSFIFDMEPGRSATEMDRPVPVAIFVVNFDKARTDPRNKGVDLDSLMYSKINGLTEQELKKQEADYIYRYRYNGGGATQVWLSSGRFVVIDLSAGPCTYGKIESEEGSVSYRSMPRLSNIIFPRGLAAPSASSTQDIFVGQLAGLISTTIEHVIAPDIRFETVDMTLRLLVPIIVLQNHNRYNILQAGHNNSIDVKAIEREVKKMVHAGQEVIVISGSHALHEHEKLSVAVSKAMRSHSLHETKSDGRFHVRTKTYLDGAILKEEMERSADVLSAGLLEVSDPSLSSRFFLKQHWMDEQDNVQDSIKHKPIWESYMPRNKKEKRGAGKKKHGAMYRTYGTRVIPVFVLSLAGLASAVGGLSTPYERASRIHERPIVNWLWSAGCHPFGPFSNSSQISQILQDVALRTTIYARVDAALRKIRDTSESVQSFASDHLKTPLGEPVKGNKNKSSTELWVEKFYKKVTTMPKPFPHGLVERLEEYLDRLEEQLVDLSSLLYDHRLVDASQNSTDILQSTIFTEQYVERVLSAERDKMECCSIEYSHPKQSSQAFVYGGILLAGFLVYSLVIFFSSPVR
ncbi:unnamed protein product [Triticum turgidum subsp. durum]|uniref:DUF7906 domain-containing protein n=1 Tax=Triticum turgidum subsp. durum TaxID=4567 RepID=A0A9R0T4Q7_TRITD|nr:unnamed protein product [Triticum turgidum subsp. durum]